MERKPLRITSKIWSRCPKNYKTCNFWLSLTFPVMDWVSHWNRFCKVIEIWVILTESLNKKISGLLFPVRRVWNNPMDMGKEWSLCCHMLCNPCITGSLLIYSNDICLTIHDWPFSNLYTYWIPLPEVVSSSAKDKKSDTSYVLLAYSFHYHWVLNKFKS